MKNTFKLYKATLKKLLIPAVIMGVLLIVSTILYLNGRMRTANDYNYYYYSFGSFFRGQPTAFSMAPGLPIFMTAGAAILTYMAFSYLNKRNASDFYQSLPYTGAQNIFSRFLAVMTYQVGIIVMTLLTAVLVLSAGGTSYDASFFPLLLCGYTAGSLLVAGAVMLAMSVTGTLVANGLVAGLILFLPRMLLFIMGQSVISMTYQRVLLGHTGILLNPVYNIVTGSLLDVTRLWQYYGLSETLINPGTIIYSAILGAVYVTLAIWLMKKRKSELAGNGATSPTMACVYGALASLPVLLYGIKGFHGTELDGMGYSSVMTLLIILAIALVIYIVVSYALCIKWKTVLKALPMFATVIVVAGGTVLGANLIAQEMGTALPDRDDIAYVTVSEEGNWTYTYNTVTDFNTMLASQVQFSDDQVVDIFYNTLKENNENWVKNRNDIYDNNYMETANVLCEFKLKSGRSFYRSVTVYAKDIDNLRDAMLSNTDYYNAYTALAEVGELYYYDDSVKDLYQSVWDMYKTEFNSLSDQEKLNLNLQNTYAAIAGYNRYSDYSNNRNVLNLVLHGAKGDKAYMQYITVANNTPKTANFYMKAVNDATAKKLPAALEKAMNVPDGSVCNLSLTWYGDSNVSTVMYYYSNVTEEERVGMYDEMSEEQEHTVVQMLKNASLSNVSINSPYVYVQLGFYGEYTDDSQNYEFYVPLTAENQALLDSIYAENQTME